MAELCGCASLVFKLHPLEAWTAKMLPPFLHDLFCHHDVHIVAHNACSRLPAQDIATDRTITPLIRTCTIGRGHMTITRLVRDLNSCAHVVLKKGKPFCSLSVRGMPSGSLQNGNRDREKPIACRTSCLVTLRTKSGSELPLNALGQKLTYPAMGLSKLISSWHIPANANVVVPPEPPEQKPWLAET